MFDCIDTSPSVSWVGPQMWPAFADRVCSHLEQMAEGSGGRYLADDIAACICDGRMQLWVIMEGHAILCVVVTEVVTYPRLRAMRYVGLVGHRPWRWMRLSAAIEAAAKQHFGCEKMEALTQPRHMALLRTGGWEVFHVLSEKVLA